MSYVSSRKESSLKAIGIIDTILSKVKDELQQYSDTLNQPLTLDHAEHVAEVIGTVINIAAAEGFKTYIQQNETRDNTVIHNGDKYQFNRTSKKGFHTPFGKIVLERRLYQNKNGESFIPLDHAWNMQNQFATSDVREAVLFALSLMPAKESRQLFEKCSPFNLAESSFKKIAENIESTLETNIDDFLETIRQEETLPVEEAEVIAISMDGANVLLQEPGKKKGRKRQRPGDRKKATEGSFDSPTSYKNATVDSVTLYGDVPPGEKAPKRLQSRYLARMPEEKSLTLEEQLQREVESTLRHLPSDMTKVFISNAAEAIFGKDSAEGNEWYESKRLQLLEEEHGAELVYRSLLYYQQSYKYAKECRESLRREVVFFGNNKFRMEYARFRSQGYPIGSGVIEAACKSIVKGRFCRSGMRWTRKGGQTILSLRAFVKSERWDEFWKRCKNAN